MPSGLNLTTKLEITGDRDLFERVSKNVRNPRSLMRNIGVLAGSSAVRRLSTVLKTDRSIRSGRLMSSINFGATGGGGNEFSIFDLSDYGIEVGSNLPYAAQRQYGGPILPTEGHKALAIPIPNWLKQSGQWPSDLDPNHDLLEFVPAKPSSAPKVVGFLFMKENAGVMEPVTRGKRKGQFQQRDTTGPLFLLVSSVEQEGTPYLYWSDEDIRTIQEELIPAWLGVN